jgi:xanthine dehydrogenase accessory factor
MKRDILERLVRDGSKPWVRALALAGQEASQEASREERLIDPSTDDTALGLAARAAARADASAEAEVEGRTWFLEVHNPPLELVLVGAVHIAQPLAAMAAMAGYAVRVIDPRTAFATEARFPGVTLTHDWPDQALAKAPLGPRSALVVLAHDPKIDDPALEAALGSEAFYVGALGSKKTHAARLERLEARGFSKEQLTRIHGPVGLGIGARSPSEIALSILAQMTQTLRC